MGNYTAADVQRYRESRNASTSSKSSSSSGKNYTAQDVANYRNRKNLANEARNKKPKTYADYGYQTQEAYDADVAKYTWASSNKGLSYADVKKRKETATGDELNYLNQYGTLVGYNNLADYDAELADIQQPSTWDKVKNAFGNYSNNIGKTMAGGAIGGVVGGLVGGVPGIAIGGMVGNVIANKDINESDDYYTLLERARNQKKLNNPLSEYQDIVNAEDFKEYSQYRPEYTKNYDYGNSYYEILNMTPEQRESIRDNGKNEGFWGNQMDMYNDDEIAVYNYLYNKGYETNSTLPDYEASQYMKNLIEAMGKRKIDNKQQESQEFSDKYGAWGDIALTGERVATQPLALVGTASGLLEAVDTGHYNPYGMYQYLYNINEGNQNVVANDIAEATPNAEVLGINVPSFLYNTGLSTADSYIGASLFGAGYSVLMGTGAFQSEAKRIIDNGGSQMDVVVQAGAAGLAEVITEYVSMDNLEKLIKNGELDSAKQVIMGVLRQSMYEGSEEVAADVINHMVDELYNGGLSDMNTKIKEYMSLGYTEAEAKKKAYEEFCIQIGESFVGGALSGGTAAFIGANRQYAKNSKEGRNLRKNNNLQAIDEAAQNIDKESEAYKRYQSALRGGNSISNANNAQIATTYRAIGNQMVSELSNENASQIEYYLTRNGMDTEEAKLASKAIAKVITEGTTQGLSKDEVKMLTNEKVSDFINNYLEGKIDFADTERATQIQENIDKMRVAEQKRTVFQDAERIERTENGYTIHNQDGSVTEVANDSVSTTESDVLNYVSKYNEEGQNIFLSNYRDSKNIALFDQAFNEVYEMGKNGESLNFGIENYGEVLGFKNVIDVYNAGNKLRNDNAVATGQMLDNVLEGFKAENFKRGKFTSKVEFKRLSNKKKNLFKVAQGLSALGLNVEVIDDNRDSALNGQYYEESNSITINLSARAYKGKDNAKQKYVVSTFAHELTHYLEYNANDAYIPLRNLVKSGLQKVWNGSVSVWDEQYQKEYDRAERKIREDAERKGKEISDEEVAKKADKIAESEVVARACENVLNDNQQMIDILSQGDTSTLNTIKEAITKFFDKFKAMIKKLLQGFESDVIEARAVKEIDGLLDDMKKAWAEAFTQAVARAQITEEMENAAGIKVDTENGTIVSELDSQKRTLANEWQNMKHKVNGKNVRYASYEECIDDVAKTIAEKAGQDAERVKEWIKAEESIAAMIMRESYAEFLDYEADDRYVPVKKNSDYPQGTFDLSNLCRKREIFTKMFDALQRDNAKILFDADDLATIRQVLVDEHYEVACALCYVEDRRQNMGEIANTFIGYYKDALKSKSKLIYKINSEGETVALKPTKDQRDKYKLPDEQYKATDKYIPNQYDLVTYEGFKALQEEHPTIAYAFERYNNSRGMASARVIEGHAEYARQVLKYTDNQIAKANSIGGLRVFSFSDFQAMHLIDVVQVINDCAKMGIKIQAYTKVPEFAELVRNTRMKVNRSLIAANVGSENAYARIVENGKVKFVKVSPYINGVAKYKGKDVLAFDIVEGIDITSKHFLDESNSANIGNILVGCNDEQIKIAMTDPFIDYIIPFHTGQRLSVLHTKGIDTWQNYKDYQEDRKIGSKEEKETEGKKKKKTKGVNIYDLMKNGKVTNKYEFFDAFMKAIKGRELIPRFDQFIDKDADGNYVYTEGYWKMLLDFKLFDAEGNILPQETVIPVNFEEEGYLENLVDEIFAKDVEREKQMRFDKDINDKIKKALESKHGKLNSEKIDSDGNTLTDEQLKYFKDSKVRDEFGNILQVYHGTVREFYTFSRDYANAEGNMGKGFYFTDNINDVEDNYANEDGADLISKIEREANQIYDKLEYSDSDEYSEYKGMDTKQIAERLKGKYITSDSPITLPVYLNITNPVYVGKYNGHAETNLFEKLFEKIGTYDEFENEEDYYDAIDEYSYDILNDIVNAIDDEYPGYGDQVSSIISSALADEYLTLEGLKKLLDAEYFEGENGEYISSELARLVCESLGYDGIIDSTVSSKFRGMGLTPDTSHFIAFRSEQIKLTTNTNPSKDSDIRYSEKIDGGVGINVNRGGRLHYVDKILDGTKTVETRRDHTLRDFVGKTVGIVETGRSGHAMLRGYIKILEEIYYPDEESFRNDYDDSKVNNGRRHLVEPGSKYDIEQGGHKYGYVIEVVEVLDKKDWVDVADKYVPGNYISRSLYSEKLDPDDVLKQNEKLAKDNEKLKADVRNLQKLVRLQGRETHGHIPTKSTIEAAAKSILKEANSTYDRASLEKEIANVWTKLTKGASINSVYNDIRAIAENVVDKTKDQVEIDKTYKRMLNDIRKTHVAFTSEQLKYAKERYGSPDKNYNDYRNAFMGKVILDKSAQTLDKVWEGWMEQYPDVFTEMSEQDMIDGLLDAYASIREASEIVVDIDTEYAINEAVQSIENKMWNIAAYQTVADKYADEIKKIKAQHRKDMATLRNERNQAKNQLNKKDDIIRKVKADRDSKINAINESIKKRKISDKEKAKRAKLVSHIEKNCIKLTNWINGRDKNHHVAVELLEPVQALLDSLDFASNRMLGISANGNKMSGANRGRATKRDVSIINAMNRMRKAVQDSLNAQKDVATTFAFPEDLVDTIEMISDYMSEIQKQVSDDMKSNNLMYQNALIVRMLDIPRLEMVDEVVSIMTGVVTEADRLIASRNAHSVDHVARMIIKDSDERNARFKFGNRFLDSVDSFINSENITPYYFFKHLGNGGMEIFTEIMDGWDAYAFKNKQITDFVDGIWKELNLDANQYVKWRDDIQKIEIEQKPTQEQKERGEVEKTVVLEMNIPQIMSFYCLNKREQGRSHIYQQGIKLSHIDGRNSNGVQQATITQEAADKITAILDKEEYKNAKLVADKLQNFMATECAKWGNEITYKRFGIMGFTEEHYFPIQVDSNSINKEPSESMAASIYRLLNMSFTKKLTEHAKNKAVINDIFDVFTNHTSDMAKYNTLALPTLDLIKVLNYKETHKTDGSQEEVVSTRDSLERAFGTRSISYIYRFLEDLNGSQVAEDSAILKTMLRNAKIAAVGANIQVALLQPMSYIRAAYNIDPKYLASALRRRPQIHKVKEECGVSCWKDQGYYDVNTNTGLVHKVKHDDNWVAVVREKSMIGAQHLDDVTWGYLYNACEDWARDNTNFATDSAEYRQSVNDKFRELAYETQVFDSTVSRSQMMRSKNTAKQILTAFGSEPTLGLNMIYDSVNGFTTDLRKGKPLGQALANNRNKMLRAFTVYTVGAILESALRAAIAKLRKPDDDDKYYELLLQHLIDELNIFTKVPIIKDIISYFEGYSVSRIEYGGIDSAVQAFNGYKKAITNGEAPTYKTVFKTIQAASQLAGIPASGAMKDVITLWNDIMKLLGYDSLILH